MNTEKKIDEIINFIRLHPESTASQAIMRRFLINKNKFETSTEISFELKNILQEKGNDEIDFCYYLVK
ncbi:hypothetical protein GM661_09905 [Iocasia frigidifontis]|uniref:Uncharacterized protein n=1 Tax=Iocasia fonsfrigidae TaxID=2682810 RepID=A0A8A7KK87_9FIRM|nr:hypothetical protein [Iocasia fonsfrigidae]MTI61151.1 hypothetical protein [Bacillota bacterium]QTL98272.1 hypothetical protein GM661_09905 [Iocasia fonsfrigidae]